MRTMQRCRAPGVECLVVPQGAMLIRSVGSGHRESMMRGGVKAQKRGGCQANQAVDLSEQASPTRSQGAGSAVRGTADLGKEQTPQEDGSWEIEQGRPSRMVAPTLAMAEWVEWRHSAEGPWMATKIKGHGQQHPRFNIGEGMDEEHLHCTEIEGQLANTQPEEPHHGGRCEHRGPDQRLPAWIGSCTWVPVRLDLC